MDYLKPFINMFIAAIGDTKEDELRKVMTREIEVCSKIDTSEHIMDSSTVLYLFINLYLFIRDAYNLNTAPDKKREEIKEGMLARAVYIKTVLGLDELLTERGYNKTNEEDELRREETERNLISRVEISGYTIELFAYSTKYGFERELWKDEVLLGSTSVGIPIDLPKAVSDYFWSGITEEEIKKAKEQYKE